MLRYPQTQYTYLNACAQTPDRAFHVFRAHLNRSRTSKP